MNKSRMLSIVVLAVMNTIVIIFGLLVATANINGQSIPIFGVQIPAFLLGFAIIYIGVRSYLKLFRLYGKLKNPNLKFSWQNFKGGF